MSQRLSASFGGPLYQQLKQDLFSRIRRGEFPPGSLLPSESQLCEVYGVSLITTRRALLELVNEGVVRRRPGVGTIVAPRVREAHLAFVSIDYAGDPWRGLSSNMGALLAGIGELAWQRNATLSTSGIDEDQAAEHLRTIIDTRGADGILIRTPNEIRPDHVDLVESAGLPYVVIKRSLPYRLINCVVSDDLKGGRLATEHLVTKGHQVIGFICAKPELVLCQERLSGYREALSSGGIAYDEELVRLQAVFTEEEGYRATRSLFEGGARPTALFVASDTMAIGAYRAIQEVGLRIPEDVAVVGYDNIETAGILQPPLTTIETSLHEFGSRSAQLLLDLVDRRVQPPQRVVIEPRLVLRQSSGAPPHKIVPLPSLAVANGDAMGAADKPLNLRVVVNGRRGALSEALSTGLSEAGAQVIPPNAGAAAGGLDAAVSCLDLRKSLDTGLERGWTDAEEMARALANRGGGALVIVGEGPVDRQGAGLAAAVRAGIEEFTYGLAERWGARAVRVNAVILFGPAADAQGVCRFLLSDAARTLTAQVIAAGDPRGRRVTVSVGE